LAGGGGGDGDEFPLTEKKTNLYKMRGCHLYHFPSKKRKGKRTLKKRASEKKQSPRVRGSTTRVRHNLQRSNDLDLRRKGVQLQREAIPQASKIKHSKLPGRGRKTPPEVRLGGRENQISR